MGERVRLSDAVLPDEAAGDDGLVGNYFAQTNTTLDFVSSGCTLLDLTLGGGWPLSRLANIIGDESTGKTLLAIEACANFNIKYPKGEMFYKESEAAFDERYAEALGMPVDKVHFAEPGEFETIEDFYNDLRRAVEMIRRKDVPGIYICDSLDALTSVAERERKFGEGSYETEKAKQMGKLLRLCNAEVSRSRMLLAIVSQTRDNIGAGLFAQKKTRSGGRALNFFASQCLWLSHLDDVTKTRHNDKRVIGIRIKARCRKNKIALPYRSCEFTIMFGHGIDSVASSLDWLEGIKALGEVTNLKRSEYDKSLTKLSTRDYWAEVRRVDNIVKRIWQEIDEELLESVRPKYSSLVER